MPNFYYLVIKCDNSNPYFKNRIRISNFTDIKPFNQPHLTFDFREFLFMLTGQWDMWIKPIFNEAGDQLVDVEPVVNCNEALDEKNNYPEVYILLSEFCSPEQPDDKLTPLLYEMEKKYWDK